MVEDLLQNNLAQSEHKQLVISESDNLHRNPETAQILAETKLLTNFLFAIVWYYRTATKRKKKKQL